MPTLDAGDRGGREDRIGPPRPDHPDRSLAVTSVPAGKGHRQCRYRQTDEHHDRRTGSAPTPSPSRKTAIDAAAKIVIEEGKTATLHLDLEAVVTAPVAAFSANVTEGDAPLTVAFTDESTGAATWSWDFGDNTTSADQNPTHTYATAGTYTVTLTVTNTAGSDRATATITVSVPVGNIAVTSTPANAAIWLDGENTGKFTNTTLTDPGREQCHHPETRRVCRHLDAGDRGGGEDCSGPPRPR